MKGILNLYKESGVTSAAVIHKARRILGIRAVGHMGTLDPAGTGVLLAGVGKGARLFDFYLKKDKEYEAEFAFGYTTDTLDGDGAVTDTTGVFPSKNQIIKALPHLTGNLAQIPPAYSAKSIGGVRAYSLARRGETPDLKPAPVRVDSFELLGQTAEHTYRFRIACSAGTYIRSLCRDLAANLGSLACMTAIHRARAGEFTDKTAVRLERLERLKESALIPLEAALAGLPRRDFPETLYQKILNGLKIDTEASEEPFTVYCRGELFGIGKAPDGKLKIPAFLKD